ncbi:hypothetical protein PHLCEN_2v11064 [Hermanssonia centrifuga]|uniref:Uncharacterized protein n=1 Tax=Hermanssonia centrifuga TaxID=98765 RepID=A0A2R6NL92_9APHY|nr:hypothetical protein PHLCEN_2v11064 [Hermanssonia centrifuga]
METMRGWRGKGQAREGGRAGAIGSSTRKRVPRRSGRRIITPPPRPALAKQLPTPAHPSQRLG